MPVNIVVTGIGGLLGQGILKALRISKYKQHKIIGCDTSRESVGLHLCDKGYIVPNAQAETYIDAIAKICAEETADVLFIGSVPELLPLAKNNEYLREKTGVHIISVEEEIIELGLDKYKTVAFLRNNDLPHPESVVDEDEVAIEELVYKVGFPLVIKPRYGAGARDMHIVSDFEELSFYRERVKEPVIQEYVGSDSEEYTCGVFSTGEQVFVISLKRELKYGLTRKAVICPDERIEALCTKIAVLLKLRGSINVQFRYGHKGPAVLEINPRYSSSTPIRAHFGFNDVEWAIDAFLFGEKINYQPACKGLAIRFWEEFYMIDDNKRDHEFIDLGKLKLENCL
jgi:carbamoyl-phosphate synthase large subunit